MDDVVNAENELDTVELSVSAWLAVSVHDTDFVDD